MNIAPREASTDEKQDNSEPPLVSKELTEDDFELGEGAEDLPV